MEHFDDFLNNNPKYKDTISNIKLSKTKQNWNSLKCLKLSLNYINYVSPSKLWRYIVIVSAVCPSVHNSLFTRFLGNHSLDFDETL